MLQWVFRSILHGGPTELCFVQAGGVTKAVVCAILSVGLRLYKDHLLLIEKSSTCCGGSRFPLYLSPWSLPYARRIITMNTMC